MARSEPEMRPLTDEEYEDAREALKELRAKTKEYLAEDLGGEPEEYEVDYPRAKRLDE